MLAAKVGHRRRLAAPARRGRGANADRGRRRDPSATSPRPGACSTRCARIDPSGLDYDAWIAIAYGLKAALGEHGREPWLAWSGRSAKHGASGSDRHARADVGGHQAAALRLAVPRAAGAAELRPWPGGYRLDEDLDAAFERGHGRARRRRPARGHAGRRLQPRRARARLGRAARRHCALRRPVGPLVLLDRHPLAARRQAPRLDAGPRVHPRPRHRARRARRPPSCARPRPSPPSSTSPAATASSPPASSDWDRDPWLLGTPGGTVDLRTGELRPARPDGLHHQADGRRAGPARHAGADLGGVPRAHLPPRPRADPLHAAGRRLRADRARPPSTPWSSPGGRAATARACSSTPLAARARRLRRRGAAPDLLLVTQQRPAPVRHGDAARRAAGHRLRSWRPGGPGTSRSSRA